MSSKKKSNRTSIIIENKFHGTQTWSLAFETDYGWRIPHSAVARAQRKLCGCDCACTKISRLSTVAGETLAWDYTLDQHGNECIDVYKPIETIKEHENENVDG